MAHTHHYFTHDGRAYVIDVESMTAGLADAAPAPAVKDQAEALAPLKEKAVPPTGKKESHPIVSLVLFLTQQCNLRCVYCYGDGGQYGMGGTMDRETAFAAVDWLIRQSGKTKNIYVSFFGGEPFLQFPLLKDIVAYAKGQAAAADKKVAFNVNTNATLLDEETVAFIRDEQLSVAVSMDGPKDIQDAQRPYADGRGSYDDIVPNIKRLLKAVPEAAGHAVLLGDTKPQTVKEALQAAGFQYISMLPASAPRFTGTAAVECARETEHLCQDMEAEAGQWLRHIRGRDTDGLASVKKNSELYSAIMAFLHNRKDRYACGAGLGLAAVSVRGDVYICHRFVGQEEYKVGTIFGEELDRDRYRQGVAASTVCAGCFARYYCAGGCKHDNLSARGSIFSPAEDMCCLKKRQLELAARIVSQLTSADKEYLVEADIFPPKPCPFDF